MVIINICLLQYGYTSLFYDYYIGIFINNYYIGFPINPTSLRCIFKGIVMVIFN